jgi:hypothetical protein
MNTSAGSAWSQDRELSSRQNQQQDLLVLTDTRHRGRDALALPFRQATVRELDIDAIPADFKGQFDTIVIDQSVDLHRLEATVRKVFPTLRDGGLMIIAFDPDDDAERPNPGSTTPTFAGLRWNGLATLNGRPCALLTVDDGSSPDPAPPGVLLTTVDEALRLAHEWHAPTRAALDRARTRLTEQLDERRLSEHALLDQLAVLANELEQARRQLTWLNATRALLDRSRPGRAALQVLRPARRLARRLATRVRTRAGSIHT